MGCEQVPEILRFRCLDKGHAETFGGRDFPESVQQHRLAHPTKTDRHQALPWFSGESAADRGAEAVDEIVSAKERRRPGTGSRSIGVQQLVHINRPFTRLSILAKLS